MSSLFQSFLLHLHPSFAQTGRLVCFSRYAPERIEYPTKRYVNESKRLYEVLDTHLQGRQWIVGDKYSLADIKAFVRSYLLP